MVFWDLGITVEVKKGEAILFLPRILTHSAVDIQGGARHVVDAFVHQAVLIWKDRKHKELTGYLRGGPKKKRRKLDIGKGKGKDPAPEAEEAFEGEDISDTEWEEEALYPREALEEVGGEEESD
ncbi:hypothetical protein GP486_008967 [Trichoglossum hirsutum]|uniref:Uncharacterized protein n=1 Tax=Trichoglossum hirsutum TaxID=265104 RepID=A0A9P8HYZ1_9PEZI|nr:hypothetical protein GP486_008967 [Trichoglossum hirsutum]